MNRNKTMKLNWPFFVFAVGVPLIAFVLGILITYPMTFFPHFYISDYWMSYIFIFLIGYCIFIAMLVYIGIPYLVTIKGDVIIFHKLFRKKLNIFLKDVERIEFFYKKVPPKDSFIGGIANMRIYIKSKNEVHVVFGISPGIVKNIQGILNEMNIDAQNRSGNIFLNKKESKQYFKSR